MVNGKPALASKNEIARSLIFVHGAQGRPAAEKKLNG